MPDPIAAPCGSWKSPIGAEQIAAGGLSFQEILLDGSNIYWVESRPKEGGRYVIVKAGGDGSLADVTPPGYSARSLVNSYGGGSFAVTDGTVYFSNNDSGAAPPYGQYNDQRLYRHEPGKTPAPLTETVGSCYADGDIDGGRKRIICVREDHTYALHGQPQSSLVAIDLTKVGPQQVLAQGNDFYAAPRINQAGTQLAWLTWNYPAMPWDESQLWVADIAADGSLTGAHLVAGGTGEAIFQPEWSPDGVLYFISDRTNWWNLYRYRSGVAEPVCEKKADFGAAQWTMRMSQYAFAGADRIIGSYVTDGQWTLADINLTTGALTPIATGLTDISHVRASRDFAVFFGGSPDSPTAVIKLDLATGQQHALRYVTDIDVRELSGYITKPQTIRVATTDGGITHAFFYPPTNPAFRVPAGEKPPLIVQNHGGPTAATSTALNLSIQYFTSRGFAVVDVNYRGSTGYGRAYRLSLYENWGKYDIDDCVACVQSLTERGAVDGGRILARGGSAGGYTTLGLVTFTDTCQAGASYYGISNLEMIIQDSDKLEAHYPEKLIGPYPADKQKYQDRSPYFHAERVKASVIFFQGDQDPVVPRPQTEVMVKALAERGLPVAAKYYPNEQHGFRIAADIQDSLESELYFYSQMLAFTPADQLPHVTIENWPKPIR